MYTFILSVFIFFLISALIYKKKLPRRIFQTALIVIGGSLITMTVVNGLVQRNYKYTKTFIKQKPLKKHYISDLNDSTYVWSVVEIDYNINHIYFRGFEVHDTNTPIIFLTDTTIVPYWKKFKESKQINSKWISSLGIPKQNRSFELYLPNDSAYHVLINNWKSLNKRKKK